MTTSYRFKGDLPSRQAQTPCYLAPPLKEIRAFSYGHIVWNLPLVDQGLLFLSLRQRLRALDERTRKEVWTLDRNASPAALTDEGLVTWVDEYAYILDPKTGRLKKKWKWPVAIECAFVGDLFVGQAFKDGELLYAASLVSGRLLWTFRPEPREWLACIFCTTPEGVFFGLDNGWVVGLSLQNGQELWRQRVPKLKGAATQVQRMACAYDGTIIFPLEGGGVIGVSAEDGTVRWKRSIGDTLRDACLYRDRYYVITSGGYYSLLNPKTGRVIFKTNLKESLPAKLSNISLFFPLLVSETHVFTGCAEGYVLAFERDTGTYVWSHRPKKYGSFQMQTYFMSVNGRFYYADLSLRMFCLEEATPSNKEEENGQSGAEAEVQGVLDYIILDVHCNQARTRRAPYFRKGGAWTVLSCRTLGKEQANFFVSVRGKKKRTMAFDQGQLWVPSVKDGEALLKVFRRRFRPGKLQRLEQGSRIKQPRAFEVTVLGKREASAAGVNESTKGSWTATKWSDGTGAVELYVNWSIAEERGSIVEKDHARAKDLCKAIASLVAR